MSEIFPSRVRAQGQSLGGSAHWVMNALVPFAFPIVAGYSKEGPFVVLMMVVVLRFLAALLFFPETTRA
jgi:MFS transporter, SP family, arabinose:H+ symporter